MSVFRAFRERQDLRRRGRDARAHPGHPDRALQYGRHPHELSRRSVNKAAGDPDKVVPGLMAIGEAACVSVHGANRLGSNSLIDLVVFGRAAALRAAEVVHPGEKHRPLPADSADKALSRLDRFRNAAGATPTAELRARMQRVMQNNCAVFRTGEFWKRVRS